MKIIHHTTGITLVETGVILFISMILIGIAIPKIKDNAVKNRCEEIQNVMLSFENAQIAYLSKTGTLDTSVTDLACSFPQSNYFTYHIVGGGAVPVILFADVAPGVKIGHYGSGTGHASTTIMLSGTVIRSRGIFAMRHLPAFK